MLLNNSTNRLTVAAGWGDNAVVPGTPVEIERIDRCPGIRRATAYVAPDLEDDMAVRCPIHHATSGSAVCLPMPALGSIVGVIHLERPERNAFDGETVQRAARVAEQVALAIANARLMLTMEGLAMTDPLTGLRNARFFDTYLEQAFSIAERDRQSVGLIMLDVDNFKKFNDTHGHPAGDEALRALGRSLRSLVRASDVVARYGGEEFVVALHNTTLSEARIVAEKIRVGVEQTVVDIGPGRFARITVSLGIAATDAHKVDRKGLVAIADAALYRAKEKGRNRVESAPTADTELGAAARRRAGRAAPERPVPIDAKAAS
jgi:diguanylate cyclase (GGDEF)-like protein